MTNAIFSCEITVPGRKTLYGHGTGYHGSTVRPLHDQTRPVRDFFRGMSCYSNAVRRHVVSCASCREDLATPEAAQLFKGAPSTFRGDRVVRSLLRKGVIAPEHRAAFIGALSPISESALWVAKFCSQEETWLALRNSVAHFAAHCRQYGYEQKHVCSFASSVTHGLRSPVGEFRYETKALHEAAPRAPEANREALRTARVLLEAGSWELPETLAEARELLPAALVHGS